MFVAFRVWRACALTAVFAAVGCTPTVREDRTIGFDSNGRAGFQHGQNGVFVTDATTGEPKRVYEPQPGDVATSPPAWEPGGKRMVFTVARRLDGSGGEPLGDAPAAGRRYAAFPIRYTCYLHDPAGGASSHKLFEAQAAHPGYVAAGLAVCWHPQGKRLDFVDRSERGRHRVRTFDIASRAATDAPLPHADNVAFGTGGPVRCVMLAGATGANGLWLEAVAGEWWDVLDSEPRSNDLADVRRALPRWSRDGTRIAFTNGTEVRVCETATRKTALWLRTGKRPGEPGIVLHWHPDGTRLGVLDGTKLGLVGPAGWQQTLTDRPVLAFAGWNAAGTRAAYTAHEPLPYSAGAKWAALFVPNANARTAICTADTNGGNEKVQVSGLHATFPHWAPNEPRLSAWLTVEPPHRLASVGIAGMRPGDPAVLIDPDAGTLDWLPVNGTEHAQIGHVELRAGRIDAALKRFDTAAAALKPEQKADWMAFRAIALQKAGRPGEASEAWTRFAPESPNWVPFAPLDPNLSHLPGAQALATQGPAATHVAIAPRHRFVAEAYISLEMAGEGIDYFRDQVLVAGTAEDRLSAALALSQLLLLADRKVEYAEFVTERLLPLTGKVPAYANTSATVAWALLPLAADEFVAALPETAVRKAVEKVIPPPGGEDVDFTCQLIRRACGRRLKDANLTEAAQRKVTTHPAAARWNLTDGEVDAGCSRARD